MKRFQDIVKELGYTSVNQMALSKGMAPQNFYSIVGKKTQQATIEKLAKLYGIDKQELRRALDAEHIIRLLQELEPTKKELEKIVIATYEK